MKPHLPHLIMLDVIRPEMRYRGRLVGTSIVDVLGFDYTGKCLDEVVPASYYDHLSLDLRDVAENAVLHYRVTDLTWNDRPHSRYHRLYAPLCRDSERIDIIVGMACVVDPNDPTTVTEPMTATIEGQTVQQSRIVLAG